MKHVVLVAGLAAAILLAGERPAEACGGCFAPPETPTVVTDHRMVFAVSRDQSTLYDQIRYQGAPESFAWVLPFAGQIEVGVSSDALFATLDSNTQTVILPPPTNCPPRPSGCSRAARASASPDQAGNGGVEVLKREVVGPYDTVQLKATDPNALIDWLAQNRYALPDDVKPVVAAYQGEHFNFLALKLVPGKGVQDMRPVRVTTKGANVALPLRMVAAGAGANVGITLWVVAEGRYEPQNFGSFVIEANELVWSWAESKSNYTDLRAKKTADGGGRVWEVESSTQLPRTLIDDQMRYERSYLPVSDAGALDPEAQEAEARSADLEVLFAGIVPGAERVTRMRADLSRAALDHDLLLRATADQSPLTRQRQVTAEIGEPQCPIFDGCDGAGTAPRSEAIRRANGDDGGCTTTTGRASPAWLAVALGFLGVSLRRRRRRN
ncbi:MAG: DUF2330 domain-containing protein [Labilithrix sp.]|nr:DUF2330 domain-containing protein [Labilithrix sp.]MCW5810045.1 DUF2330 domain-containing protein [Labilithrix sp.]